MTKFQVGDTVRHLGTDEWLNDRADPDQLLTIAAVLDEDGWTPCVKIQELVKDHPTNFRYEHHFELVSRAGKVSPAAGRKDDGGKLDMTLLDDMPRAIEAVVAVMQWAIKDKQPKPYERGSWLDVSADRYRAAILRHDSAAAKQASAAPQQQVPSAPRFQRDDETKMLHLAHQACSALFALELTLRELEGQQ